MSELNTHRPTEPVTHRNLFSNECAGRDHHWLYWIPVLSMVVECPTFSAPRTQSALFPRSDPIPLRNEPPVSKVKTQAANALSGKGLARCLSQARSVSSPSP